MSARGKKGESRAERRRREAKELRAKDRLRICGAQNVSGSICTRPAGWGMGKKTGRCKPHHNHRKNAVTKAARAEMEANGMAQPIHISTDQALTAVLRLAAGQLTYATRQVAKLRDEQLFVEGYSPDTGTISKVPHHWLKLQRDCMHDLARYAKLCADANINERHAVLAETQTAMMAAMMEKIVGSLDLTEEQRAALGPAIRKELNTIEGKSESSPYTSPAHAPR